MQARPLFAGSARGQLVVSSEPLSFWGGFDFRTGRVIDRRHPLAGECATGRILALPFTRGSSSTTAVLLEAAKAGTAPAAILTTAPDPFFVLASIVAEEMYSRGIPIALVGSKDFAGLATGKGATLGEDGTIEVFDSVDSL